MGSNTIFSSLVVLGFSFLVATYADADCAGCGTIYAGEKVCRLTRFEHEKKVTFINEEVKLPAAKKTIKEKLSWLWTPRGKIKSNERYETKTFVKRTPGYKWVVEDMCTRCFVNAVPVQVPEAEAKLIPKKPLVDDVTFIGSISTGVDQHLPFQQSSRPQQQNIPSAKVHRSSVQARQRRTVPRNPMALHRLEPEEESSALVRSSGYYDRLDGKFQKYEVESAE